MTHLEIQDDFAEGISKEPSFSHIPNDSWRETEQNDHKVRHGQIEDEVIGDRVHGVVPVDGHTNQRVSHEAHQKDNQVGRDEEPFNGRGEDVGLEFFQNVLGWVAGRRGTISFIIFISPGHEGIVRRQHGVRIQTPIG